METLRSARQRCDFAKDARNQSTHGEQDGRELKKGSKQNDKNQLVNDNGGAILKDSATCREPCIGRILQMSQETGVGSDSVLRAYMYLLDSFLLSDAC